MPEGSRLHVYLLHAFDPRGTKVGGIETFVRDYIRFLPSDFELTLVGIDNFGDLRLGEINQITVGNRRLNLFPVVHFAETMNSTYAKNLAQSLTLRYALGLVRYAARLRHLIKSTDGTVDLRRTEHAFFPVMLNIPFIQMLHDGAFKGAANSSLLTRYWFVKELSERFALRFCDRFFCVSRELAARIAAISPDAAGKVDTLPTWADPNVFGPTPFVLDGTIRVLYGGRMDMFKRPDLMFRVIAELRRATPRKIEFHYVGDGDVEQFKEFAAIRDVTVRHGRKGAAEVAGLISRMHVGLLTSEYEGMPRIVLEILASGRPVVALHLPQLETVVQPKVSGALVERGDEQVKRTARAILDVYEDIEKGTIQPKLVANCVRDYRPETVLPKLFNAHRELRSRDLVAVNVGQPH